MRFNRERYGIFLLEADGLRLIDAGINGRGMKWTQALFVRDTMWRMPGTENAKLFLKEI